MGDTVKVPMMKWSPQQSRALDAVSRWLKRRSPQVFYLGGYAGTGKTTLVKHFAEGVDGLVLFMTYTGKAAMVMIQKGVPDATTIHSAIYKPRDRSRVKLMELRARLAKATEEREVERLKREVEREEVEVDKPAFKLDQDSLARSADLFVIDEVSMVNKNMGQDLLSFGKPVLVLGDPAQLPPVRGAGFFTSGDPDFMLTEIHRQALDNPILEVATMAREQRHVPYMNRVSGKLGVEVIPRREMDPVRALASDQLICGTNKYRRSLNLRLRELLGHKSLYPEKNERLICLRNDKETGLLNGMICHSTTEARDVGNGLEMSVRTELGQDLTNLPVLEGHFDVYLTGQEVRTPWHQRMDYQEFDYGYAITCHKAQGSQWDDVIVFDSRDLYRGNGSNPMLWRWMYTAFTRASEKLTYVR